MYYKYVYSNSRVDYSLYLLTLMRYIILQDTSEYDKLNIYFKIPQFELDYFFEWKPYMFKTKKINLFDKIKNKTLIKNQQHDFHESLEFVDNIISAYSGKEKNEILEKIITIIYRDISSDYSAAIFYNKNPEYERLGLIPFPLYDENHKSLSIDDFIMPCSTTLNLSNDNVIINPMWKRTSVKGCIDYLQQKKWTYSKTNHLAYKYSIIDIGYVYNGIHSSAIGQIYKQGIIENVKVINTEKLYKYIYTDGLNWYHKFDKSIIVGNKKIEDIRFPLIFEIGRKIE